MTDYPKKYNCDTCTKEGACEKHIADAMIAMGVKTSPTIIDEDDEVKYTKLESLSYLEYGSGRYPEVKLFVGNKYVGDIKVWLDSEMDDREYLCINHEIIYLDDITKK